MANGLRDDPVQHQPLPDVGEGLLSLLMGPSVSSLPPLALLPESHRVY
jgi:hypothetical protein